MQLTLNLFFFYSFNTSKNLDIAIDSVIIKINDEIKDKKDLEKIILCDVPNLVYPELETSFLNLIHNSGHPGIKFEKKVDFNKLYNERTDQ